MNRITPIKAIRFKCMDCMCNSSNAVKTCPVTQCNLWKFRLGIHAFTKKNSSNSFLEPNNFIGTEDMSETQIIKMINAKVNKNE